MYFYKKKTRQQTDFADYKKNVEIFKKTVEIEIKRLTQKHIKQITELMSTIESLKDIVNLYFKKYGPITKQQSLWPSYKNYYGQGQPDYQIQINVDKLDSRFQTKNKQKRLHERELYNRLKQNIEQKNSHRLFQLVGIVHKNIIQQRTPPQGYNFITYENTQKQDPKQKQFLQHIEVQPKQNKKQITKNQSQAYLSTTCSHKQFLINNKKTEARDKIDFFGFEEISSIDNIAEGDQDSKLTILMDQ